MSVSWEEGVELTQMEYEFWPEALEATIRYASAMTGLPVIVTENGIATDDDTRRIAYIERALHGVAACLRDGIDVRGYIYWSALDNFEWLLGYRPTFGLIAVNRHTQERSEEHTSELQSPDHLVCRLLLEKKKRHNTHRLQAITI